MSKHIFWLASYPKSGNTLIRAILSSLFFTENGIFNLKLLESISNLINYNILKAKDLLGEDLYKLNVFQFYINIYYDKKKIFELS